MKSSIDVLGFDVKTPISQFQIQCFMRIKTTLSVLGKVTLGLISTTFAKSENQLANVFSKDFVEKSVG